MFVLSFIGSWIATKEVYWISKVHPARAAFWALLNCGFQFVVLYVIVITAAFYLIIPDCLGNALATYLVLRGRQRTMV